MTARIPVTLLTGFLGSGKTTLVNHLLTEQSHLRIAVIVNEFGPLGIDAALIASRTEDVLELANGCVCCANRGDLVRTVEELVSAGRSFDHLVIESSGLADPGPVVQALVEERLADRLTFAGTVTCIDAANFDGNLEHAEAAYHQITLADLLIVNKVDLVGGDIVARIQAGLHRLNASAPQLTAVRCAVDVPTVLGQRSTARTTSLPSAQEHDHGGHAFSSVTVGSDRPVDAAKLSQWLSSLTDAVVRAKGIVHLTSYRTPRSVHMVSGSITFEEPPPTRRAPGAHRSAMVLIGTALDEARLQREFVACAG